MRIHRKCTASLITLCLTIAVAAPALAETPAPGWEVNQGTYPSSLPPGGSGQVVLAIYNVGSEASKGPVTVTDRLPAGVTATEAGYFGSPHAQEYEEEGPLWKCTTGTVVTCTNNPAEMPSLPPGEVEWLEMKVDVPAHPSGSALNEVVVAGGGAGRSAVVSSPLTLSATPSSFGFQRLDGWFSSLGGTLSAQAGSHPYAVTLSFFLNNTGIEPTHQARNITVNLPPGLVGNPTAVPRCTRPELDLASCPADTQVGVDEPVLAGPGEGGGSRPDRRRPRQAVRPALPRLQRRSPTWRRCPVRVHDLRHHDVPGRNGAHGRRLWHHGSHEQHHSERNNLQQHHHVGRSR